ncbi:MAG: PspC domain-containing protein [Actinomycetaceae bacterium]|nr:PspC domain-containing protein [Actinomycetaceae bacterium]
MTNYQGPQNPQPFGDTFFQSLRNSVWRRPEDRWIGGVCAAISYRFDWDVSLVRGVTVILTLFTGGIVFLAYALGWALIPEPNDDRIHIEELLRGRFDIAHVGIFAFLMGGLSGGIRFGVNIFDTPDFFSIGLYRALVPVTGVLIVIAFLLIAVSMRKNSAHRPPSQRYPGQPQAPWSTHYENDRPTPGPNGATPPTVSAPYVPTPHPEDSVEPLRNPIDPEHEDAPSASTESAGQDKSTEIGSALGDEDKAPATSNDGDATPPTPYIATPDRGHYHPPYHQHGSPMIQPRYDTGVPYSAPHPKKQMPPAGRPATLKKARQPGPGLPTFLGITGALFVIGAVVWMLSLGSLDGLGLPYASQIQDPAELFIIVQLPIIVGSAFILSGLTLTIRALQGKPGTWLTVLTIIAAAILPWFILITGAEMNYNNGLYW